MRSRFAGRVAATALGLLAAASVGLVGGTLSGTVTPAPAAAASAVGGYISRSEIMQRATNWFNRDLTYNQSGTAWDIGETRQYRRDCSGFIDMAWHLGADPNTEALDSYAYRINRDELLPGDTLINIADNPNHAILFGGWENTARSRFWYYSFGSTPVVRVNGASFDWANLSGHPTSGYISYRYRKIADPINIYGLLPDGRLTFTSVSATGVRTHGAVVSTATIPFRVVAMAVLNFNTILITSDTGQLYRVDVITNNNSLVFNPPEYIGSGWTHRLLAYDGSGHLYGIAGSTLRRYDITTAKPGFAGITGNVVIGDGFSQKTLTTTGPDRILGNHADGRLLSYRIVGPGDWQPYELRSSTWQVFDHILSAGNNVYLGRRPDHSMVRYLDTDPRDGDGSDISSASVVDADGWTQVLLSAQPITGA